MVFAPPRAPGSSDGFREVLEASYRKRNLVHLSAGSSVPLLRDHLWFVVRGMVKLGALTIHGDELMLGLAGPNEPFGDPLVGVEAHQATTLCASDLLCFSLAEIRREPELAVALLEHANLRLYPDECRVCRDGVEVNLSPKEYRLLELFMQHPRRVWSRDKLLEHVWGHDYFGDSKTVDVHIRWLREKLEANPSAPAHLLTVRGFGYRFG